MSDNPMRLRARPGVTLIELLIVMVMMGIVGGALASVLNGQQRFARATSEAGSARVQLQTAAAVLPADLRMVSPVGGDILSMSDSSITVRSTIATSVVCVVAGNVVTLAPTATGAASYTHVVSPPEVGDSVFIWFDNSPTMSSDDVWGTAADPALPYEITTVATTPGGCPQWFAPVGNTQPAYALTLASARTFAPGAPVRITRTITYGLYQSPMDSQWYLGLMAPGDADYKYLAGPFRSYSATPGQSGLQLQYFDTTGAPIATPTQVGRIALTVRAEGAAKMNLSGADASKPFRDTLRVGISLRNRIW